LSDYDSIKVSVRNERLELKAFICVTGCLLLLGSVLHLNTNEGALFVLGPVVSHYLK